MADDSIPWLFTAVPLLVIGFGILALYYTFGVNFTTDSFYAELGYLMVILLIALIFGFISRAIHKNRSPKWAFVLGFWLGFIGWIIGFIFPKKEKKPEQNWVCEYCNKKFMTREATVKHEETCKKRGGNYILRRA